MLQVKYAKLYPMGNSTVLIWDLDSSIGRENYNKIASTIMVDKYLPCEQVGFIVKAKNDACAYKLVMMGGELCVNALRSLAFLHYKESGELIFSLESSGSEEIFNMKITPATNMVSLSCKMHVEHIRINKNLGLVHLEGISHFVEDVPDINFTNTQISQRLEDLLLEYKDVLSDVEAIGYIPYVNQKHISITPLVYVRDTDTKILESSCGSGTIAVGVQEFLNSKHDSFFSIKQPTGSIFSLSVDEAESGFYALSIESGVQLVSTGDLFIELE